MTGPFELGQNTGLELAVLFGFFFGLSLERGELGNPHVLTGLFYKRDFSVPKTVFTAIVVASVGLYFLEDAGLVDVSQVWIIPTFFWPQLIGGALFGIGYLLSGYCPGTGVVGLASGRLDALIIMLGILAGSFLFALLYPVLEGFYLSTSMGAITLQKILGVNHWFVIFGICILAGGMFAFFKWYENNRLPLP